MSQQNKHSGRLHFIKTSLFFLLTLCVTSQLCSASSRSITAIEADIISLAADGCVILADERGNTLFSHHPQKKLIPASIIKIYTSLVAMTLLGKDYRFQTEFYMDERGRLAIKGWGDPFLISEEIEKIAGQFQGGKRRQFKQIVLDTSTFSDNLTISGLSGSLNPYDALNGALIVNFNTINAGKDQAGQIYSAEEETPLTPLAFEKAQLFAAGTEDRISLSTDRGESERYVVELFVSLFEKNGISIENKKPGNVIVDNGWELIYTHHNSIPLEDILIGLLKYSNNFIANQLFFVMGAEQHGYPATISKARSTMMDFMAGRITPDVSAFQIDEASGISRDTLLTGEVMMLVLEHFRPYRYLLNAKNGIQYKSGTLTGVYNYAGFFSSAQGGRPFIIVVNDRKNTRDRILQLLKEYNNRF